MKADYPIFKDGYSVGWFFTLPEAFAAIIKRKFPNFETSYFIYDCKEGYTLPWEKSLKNIKLCIRINQASVYKPVNFTVLKPNPNATSVISIQSHSAEQDAFVHFLQTGILNRFTDYRFHARKQ